MIRITVELLVRGNENNKKHLGTAEITNLGTGTNDTGNYKITLSKWGNPKSVWKSGYVSGFRRLKQGPWDLLLLGLISTIGNRINVNELRQQVGKNSEKIS